MVNSVDPDQTAPILNSSVMLGNNLQQTTSADDIFRCIFFLGTLRVNIRFYNVKINLMPSFVRPIYLMRHTKTQRYLKSFYLTLHFGQQRQYSFIKVV